MSARSLVALFLSSETFVNVETLVFQQKDLWITLWMECMDDSDNVDDILNSVRRRAAAKVVREHCTMKKAGYARRKKQHQTLPHVSVRRTFSVLFSLRLLRRMLAPQLRETTPSSSTRRTRLTTQGLSNWRA